MHKINFLLLHLLIFTLGCQSTRQFQYREVAQDQNELRFKNLDKFFQGLAQKEADALRDIIGDQRIVDLEVSGLSEFKNWLDELNTRLSEGVQSLGKQYPDYRIYLIDDLKPNAYIYKFKPAGQQFYVGHTFLSVGLIKKLFSAQEVSSFEASKLQINRALNALSGIIAHEFAHPKQDEIVKFNIRKEQGNHSAHGQIDEISTDVIGIKLLKKSNLDPSGMLEGLELLTGVKVNDNKVFGAIKAGVSTHPESSMRINLIRGALSNLRISEGKNEIIPISFDLERMRNSLINVESLNDIETKVKVSISKKVQDLNFSNIIEDFLDRASSIKEISEDELLGYFKLLSNAQIDNKYDAINSYKRLLVYQHHQIPHYYSLSLEKKRKMISYISKVDFEIRSEAIKIFKDSIFKEKKDSRHLFITKIDCCHVDPILYKETLKAELAQLDTAYEEIKLISIKKNIAIKYLTLAEKVNNLMELVRVHSLDIEDELVVWEELKKLDVFFNKKIIGPSTQLEKTVNTDNYFSSSSVRENNSLIKRFKNSRPEDLEKLIRIYKSKIMSDFSSVHKFLETDSFAFKKEDVQLGRYYWALSDDTKFRKFSELSSQQKEIVEAKILKIFNSKIVKENLKDSYSSLEKFHNFLSSSNKKTSGLKLQNMKRFTYLDQGYNLFTLTPLDEAYDYVLNNSNIYTRYLNSFMSEKFHKEFFNLFYFKNKFFLERVTKPMLEELIYHFLSLGMSREKKYFLLKKVYERFSKKLNLSFEEFIKILESSIYSDENLLRRLVKAKIQSTGRYDEMYRKLCGVSKECDSLEVFNKEVFFNLSERESNFLWSILDSRSTTADKIKQVNDFFDIRVKDKYEETLELVKRKTSTSKIKEKYEKSLYVNYEDTRSVFF